MRPSPGAVVRRAATAQLRQLRAIFRYHVRLARGFGGLEARRASTDADDAPRHAFGPQIEPDGAADEADSDDDDVYARYVKLTVEVMDGRRIDRISMQVIG